MATCQEVVTHAYRMAGIVGMSAYPTAKEADYALAALQTMLLMWFDTGLFGTLADRLVTEDCTAAEFDRIISASDVTVTLPLVIDDNGIDRSAYDLSPVQTIIEGVSRRYVMDKTWQALDALELAGGCPLADRGVHGMAANLALEVMEPYGKPPTAMIGRTANLFKSGLAYKNSTRPASQAEYF
jgi:hypothetical protein